MAPAESPEKTKEAPKGRFPKNKGKRPATKASSDRNRGGSSKPPLQESPKSFLLPFITLWLIAAIALGGLIYWGVGQKSQPTKHHDEARSGSKSESAAASRHNTASTRNPIPHHPVANQANAPASSGHSSFGQAGRVDRTHSGNESEIEIDVAPVSKSAQSDRLSQARSAQKTASTAEDHPASAHSVPGSASGSPAGAQIHAKSGDASGLDNPGFSQANQSQQQLALIPPSGAPGNGSLAPSFQGPTPSTATPVARVAIVIDDFGPDMKMAKKFLDLPIPITFSVLPFQPHSRDIAQLAHSNHHEVLLHMPMEPLDYPKANPGKGALLVSMSAETIQKSLRSALDASPFISGVNNHMGSRFTENSTFMKLVLAELHNRGLYFLDSCTSPKSVGVSVAQELHVPSSHRDIFLDYKVSEQISRSQIEQLIRRARIRGSAIAIGHPHESTLRALRKMSDRFKQEKIAVVPVGEIVLNR